MLLYTNGCSMTSGEELDLESSIVFKDEDWKYKIEYQKEHAWPQKLADKLGWDVYNDAQSGGSNDRILRTTIDYISSLSDTTDLTVIIGWTFLPRYDLYLNENNGDIKNCYTQLLLTIPNPYIPFTKVLGELLYMHSYNEQIMYDHYFKAVLYMQMYLEKKNIPYIMFNVGSIKPKNNIIHDANMLNEIDSTKFVYNEPRRIPGSHCFYDAVEDKYPQHPGFHPYEIAHDYWADVLFEHITNNQKE